VGHCVADTREGCGTERLVGAVRPSKTLGEAGDFGVLGLDDVVRPEISRWVFGLK
jgi:hypothetical protein